MLTLKEIEKKYRSKMIDDKTVNILVSLCEKLRNMNAKVAVRDVLAIGSIIDQADDAICAWDSHEEDLIWEYLEDVYDSASQGKNYLLFCQFHEMVSEDLREKMLAMNKRSLYPILKSSLSHEDQENLIDNYWDKQPSQITEALRALEHKHIMQYQHEKIKPDSYSSKADVTLEHALKNIQDGIFLIEEALNMIRSQTTSSDTSS